MTSKHPEGTRKAQRVIKKYPNRRLYDTDASAYITLSEVRQLVMDGESFVVSDAKTGEDLTRSILMQIILEQEAHGSPMFTTPVLCNIIRFYGHTMQGMMGAYLEKNLLGFVEMQKRFTEQTGDLYEGKPFTPEAWAHFMSLQTPVMQNVMSSYLDQSKSMFAQMQEQMQKQAESFFPGMPGFKPPGT